MQYFLARSAVRMTGIRVTTTDLYGPSTTSFQDLSVEWITTADPEAHVDVDVRRKGRDIDASFTPDGRLLSLEYKATGAGPAIVSAVAKLVVFIGSVALSAAGALSGPDKGTPRDRSADPRATWEGENSDLVDLLTRNRTLAKDAYKRLAELRERQLEAEPQELRGINAQIAAAEQVVAAATAEVTRIEKLYASWRDAQRTRVESDLSVCLAAEDIPVRTLDPPIPSSDLWEDYGIHLELVDSARIPEFAARPQRDTGATDVAWWRQSRDAQLWTWKRDADGNPSLVTVQTVRVVDASSGYCRMELTSAAFGTHGGSLTFNDDGSPSRLTSNRESTWATLANALAAAPDAMSAGAAQAKSLVETVVGLSETKEEQARRKAVRDLEIAKSRQDLAGVEATDGDYAELLRAEQAVKLRTAGRAVTAQADALDDVKQQVEIATKQNELDAAARAAGLEKDLADLRAEVARIELVARRDVPGSSAGE